MTSTSMRSRVRTHRSGTPRARDASSKGRTVQRTHRLKAVSSKGHIVSRPYRPRDALSKGQYLLFVCLRFHSLNKRGIFYTCICKGRPVLVCLGDLEPDEGILAGFHTSHSLRSLSLVNLGMSFLLSSYMVVSRTLGGNP